MISSMNKLIESLVFRVSWRSEGSIINGSDFLMLNPWESACSSTKFPLKFGKINWKVFLLIIFNWNPKRCWYCSFNVLSFWIFRSINWIWELRLFCLVNLLKIDRVSCYFFLVKFADLKIVLIRLIGYQILIHVFEGYLSYCFPFPSFAPSATESSQ